MPMGGGGFRVFLCLHCGPALILIVDGKYLFFKLHVDAVLSTLIIRRVEKYYRRCVIVTDKNRERSVDP